MAKANYVAVRMGDDIYKPLCREAVKSRVSVSEMIRAILRKHLVPKGEK